MNERPRRRAGTDVVASHLGRRWIRACAIAETIGMTAAAAASVAARHLESGPAALSLVVVGGLVEGTALGSLQGRVLAARWGRPVWRGWLVVTVIIAGLGWAAASAPGTLADDGDGGDQPALVLVLAGAAALGATMGAVLGAAQAAVLRRTTAVPHPWRWIGTSAAGWAVAMPVIFLGATIPAADWPAVAVLAMGPPTGLIAGTALGVVTRRVVDELRR
ncbi:hypothetical protein GCM10009798_39880 [Nocardioides panacihumi]|uniref:Uncharacterized protein n=1 Tax=Nocardioides panacihumi TaxID=400774 RepID=A0ABN2RTK5_9ACTN